MDVGTTIQHFCCLRDLRNVLRIVGAVACLMFPYGTVVFAQDPAIHSENVVVSRAREAWIDGSSLHALDILGQALRKNPHSLKFRKLRGDILATIRRNQEALDDYEAVLKASPESLAVRWAKWSVFTRLGRRDSAIVELQRIAQRSPDNPLVYLRLAQDLRKLDRLEESVEWQQKAVELVPALPGWRLNLARALFDVLHYEDARKEVQAVLQTVERGSPVEVAARNLLMITYGATKERGRRYQPVFSPGGSAADRKRWGLIRHQAWEHFSKGRYREAEPILRELLILKPTDHRVMYELGSTLMELGQHEESIRLLQEGIAAGPASGEFNEVFLDSIFRIGRSLVGLERWQEALIHFEILQEIETGSSESLDVLPATLSGKIIDKEELAFWLEQVWQHLPRPEKPAEDFNALIPAPDLSNPLPTYYKDMVAKKFQPDELLHTRVSLMGRDADFSWFRFIIPASHIMRDDRQAGNHEFIPLHPNDTFLTTQQEIYLVFALILPSFEGVPLITECFLETSKMTWEQTSLARDKVVMTMNEQSGYFVLSAPESEWAPGLYRCGLFVGDEVSAYTQADEVRFRIVETLQSS